MTVTFSFDLDTKYMTHIKEVSYYNHNYYKLDLNQYGDYIIPESCDVLYEECDEFYGTYTYTLGYFVNGTPHFGEFERCFTWTEMECKTHAYTGEY